MPFVVACDPPQDQNTPSDGKGKGKAPLRPALANITPTSSPSTAVKRTPLGVKNVASPEAKDRDSEANSEEAAPRFPSATIQADSIGPVMAARLVACLLGHVLFLKSQTPLPVAHLKRMSLRTTSDQRPNKKLDALLSSFDVLSNQLVESFAALAVALSTSDPSAGPASHRPRFAKSHVAIILGPSPTTMIAAQARVVLEIDGLRVAWGKKEPLSNVRLGFVPNEGLKENVRPYVSIGGSIRDSRPFTESECPRDSSSSSLSSDVASDEEIDQCNIVPSPPESDSESNSGLSEDDSGDELKSHGLYDEMLSTPETEADIAAAERTLSRTIAIANSDPELGMTHDTRPTQIHILIRAPRRFSHPAWIPRQNLDRDMDPVLREFEDLAADKGTLDDITNSVRHDGPLTKATQAGAKRGKGVRTDYVRVRSRGAEESLDLASEDRIDGSHTSHPGTSESPNEGADSDERFEDKGDELIWWSWDGRLEGFTDI